MRSDTVVTAIFSSRFSVPSLCLFVLSFVWMAVIAPTANGQVPSGDNQAEVTIRKSHGLSLFGSLKYPADFAHFDYVNPNAPKGGTVRLSTVGSFDSLNQFTIEGNPATALALIYDQLLIDSADEPGSEYGLIAESVEVPSDYSWATFHLREEARWHDGKPVTPEDVIFSLTALKEGLPTFRFYYANIVEAQKVGERSVKFIFDEKNNRELPLITGQLYVLPKHYWEGIGQDGEPRNIKNSTLEKPLGSGPYKIGKVEPGRFIEYERVKDYWGADLPVSRGQDNFDVVRYEFFFDSTIALEAFFAGRYDIRVENSSKNWETQYENKPAVQEGKVKRLTIPSELPSGMQAFFFNTRKGKFSDRRVREALGLAFDFEWSNKNLFFDLYNRTNSYFDNSELAAKGLPGEGELALLEPYRDQLPAEVFEKEFKAPVNDGTGNIRASLRRAFALLKEAGWELKDQKLTHLATNEVMTIEFLLQSGGGFERVVQPYISNLERLGISASIRPVDDAQYVNRLDTFNFDMVVNTVRQSLSPGNEQREFWGSAAADREGSRNVAGIKNPVIDALIEKLIFAEDRDALITATKALDRVLLWNHYVVPQWYKAETWVGVWDRFGRPDNPPPYSTKVPKIWWSKEAEAASVVQPAKSASVDVAVGGALQTDETLEETKNVHGLSTFGDLKYPPDFEHFDYVNPDAPKGGKLSAKGITAQSSFDSLNAYILKGDPAEGLILSSADGTSLVFDSLMTRAGDEPDSVYGLVASRARIEADGSGITFFLRPEARFHDGTPLTAEDVAFSFAALKEQGDPRYRQSLRDVTAAEAISEHEIRYTFAPGGEWRDLPIVIAELPIFSKVYYATRKFDETTLEPPLGSGPYKVGTFAAGRFIEYERVPDYWAKDLPVNVGRWNFDTLRYEYFRDREIAFEAFKSNQYDLREEFTSKVWQTQYDFPAIQRGDVQRRSLPDDTPSGVQGYFLNTRRPHLSDPRIRAALDLAHDFEWTNKNLFYNLYDRTESFFEGSKELMASGPAEGLERDILLSFGERLPVGLLDAPYVPPVTDGSGRNRLQLRLARDALSQADLSFVEGKLTDKEGQPLVLEFLMFEPSFERVIAPFKKNLELLGFTVNMRLVDSAQYQRRVEDFDFDITVRRYSQRLTPGVELRNYFSSIAAGTKGSLNLAGVRDPLVDDLIERVLAARSREELNAASRALDRVLRSGHYWVSHWSKAAHHIAYWDKYAWPETKPKYRRGILDTWWAQDADSNSAATSKD